MNHYTTPFAQLEQEELEKQSSSLLRAGLKGAGKLFRRSSNKAKQVAFTDAKKMAESELAATTYASGLTSKELARATTNQGREAAGMVANRRRDAGRWLGDSAKKIDNLTDKQRLLLDAGIVGGVGLGGATVAGGIGHSKGVETGTRDGLTRGIAAGYDNGLQLGYAQGERRMGTDPGIMGRLMEVFTGRKDNGPSRQQLGSQLALKRNDILGGIMRGVSSQQQR